MEILKHINHEAVLTLVLRLILGTLFFFQGYDKVFRLKMKGVVSFFRQEHGSIKVPDFVLTLAAWFTSYVELICGALLILGLFKSYALAIIGIDLVLVTAAFSLIKPMWDMQMLFPRLILWTILMYLPFVWDVFSADHLFYKLF